MRDIILHDHFTPESFQKKGVSREKGLKEIRRFVCDTPGPVSITVREHGAVITIYVKDKPNVDRFISFCWEIAGTEPIELQSPGHHMALEIRRHSRGKK